MDKPIGAGFYKILWHWWLLQKIKTQITTKEPLFFYGAISFGIVFLAVMISNK